MLHEFPEVISAGAIIKSFSTKDDYVQMKILEKTENVFHRLTNTVNVDNQKNDFTQKVGIHSYSFISVR